MPRQEGRSRTVREEAPLTPDRGVQINSQKRFFSNRGSDSANRTARALIDATSAGVNLKQHLMVKADDEGRERAVKDAAAGEWQDQQDDNEGYMAAWSYMDAEKELGRLRRGLPEHLKSIDAHTLDEQQFVDAIDAWVQPQLQGVEETGVYGRVMAPGVLAIYEEQVTAHKDAKLAEIHAGQQEDIAEVAQNRFEANGGVWDHDYIAAQTHMFPAHEDRVSSYWTQEFAGAMFNADVKILDEALEQFPDGSSTGKNDPAFQEEFEQMRAKVLKKMAVTLDASEELTEKINKRRVFELQVEVYEKGRRGDDISGDMTELYANPETTFAQYTGAETAANSQFLADDKLQENTQMTSKLWSGLHTGEYGITEIFDALASGYLGGGTHGNELMNSMMSLAKQYENSRAAQTSSGATEYRSILNKNYNASRGALVPDDPFKARINIEANLMYTALLADGEQPIDAYNTVTAKFDPMVAAQPKISTEHLGAGNYQTQSRFAADMITAVDLKRVLAGEEGWTIDRYIGVPKQTWLLRLSELYNDGAGDISLTELSELVQARR